MIRSRLDRCSCPPGLTYSHVTQAGLMMIMKMVRLLLLMITIIMIIMVMMIVIMILLLSSEPDELRCKVTHQTVQMRRELKLKVFLASIECSLIHVKTYHFCLGVALISPAHRLLSRT